jgi:hypothetical protein
MSKKLPAFGMTAFAVIVHPAFLGVRAIIAAVILGRRARAFASRMLALIFGLYLFHTL